VLRGEEPKLSGLLRLLSAHSRFSAQAPGVQGGLAFVLLSLSPEDSLHQKIGNTTWETFHLLEILRFSNEVGRPNFLDIHRSKGVREAGRQGSLLMTPGDTG